MTKTSAGLLMYRRLTGGELEVLLVHPGGPYWAKKDEGAWSIPKGEYTDNEDARDAAIREFEEELGFAPSGDLIELGQTKLASGKIVSAWALEGDWDPANLSSNTFKMEWPPKSGVMTEFPEVDRAAWFDIDTARVKINSGQIPFLDTLVSHAR